MCHQYIYWFTNPEPSFYDDGDDDHDDNSESIDIKTLI